MKPSIDIIILLVIVFNLFQSASAKELQRLFTTAQDRAILNAKREEPPPAPPLPTTGSATPSPVAPRPKPPRYITFNGLIKRSHGPTTLWINDSQDLFRQGFSVELDKITEKTVPIFLFNKRRIELKPGQSVNTLNGTIKENWE
ncbi:MAG: hypothetical protein DRR16_31440 [Candidatus Parabeggiatoa sp. nov. 3]|nr:MAG: hypothetical protein DRR00_34120 [Gammaproteobacteria bacterium]RKZ75277.1 MAG: hypothetical protein DRR16_31440 [Gammaproteobacteria bacterium]